MGDPYAVLDVDENVDAATIRAAFRQQVKIHHPDQGGSAQRLQEIKAAYEQLNGGSQPEQTHSRSVGDTTEHSTSSTQEPTSESRTNRGQDHRQGSDSPPADKTAQQTTAATNRASGTAQTDTERSEQRVAQPEEDARGQLLRAQANDFSVSLTELIENPDTTSLLPEYVTGGWRVAACFRVESGKPAEWATRRLTFRGIDGEVYRPSAFRPTGDDLPDGWVGDTVSLRGNDRARVFVLSEPLPAGVTIEELRYRHNPARGRAGDLVFAVGDELKPALSRDPFKWQMLPTVTG